MHKTGTLLLLAICIATGALGFGFDDLTKGVGDLGKNVADTAGSVAKEGMDIAGDVADVGVEVVPGAKGVKKAVKIIKKKVPEKYRKSLDVTGALKNQIGLNQKEKQKDSDESSSTNSTTAETKTGGHKVNKKAEENPSVMAKKAASAA